MIKSGELRHRLELQEQFWPEAQPREDNGQREMTWIVQATAFAAVKQIGGQTDTFANQETTVGIYQFATRYQRDLPLDTSWRIKWNGRIFHITNIINVDELGERWEITATEFKDVRRA